MPKTATIHTYENSKYSRAFSPAAAVTDNTAYVTQILDVATFLDNILVILLGAIADADVSFTVLLEESDASDMSGANAVTDADLLGTEAGAQFLFSDDNKVVKLGYRGTKRYIRATITPANNSGNIFLAAVWHQAGPRTSPQTTQIV